MYDKFSDRSCDADIAVSSDETVNFNEQGNKIRDDSINILGHQVTID